MAMVGHATNDRTTDNSQEQPATIEWWPNSEQIVAERWPNSGRIVAGEAGKQPEMPEWLDECWADKYGMVRMNAAEVAKK